MCAEPQEPHHGVLSSIRCREFEDGESMQILDLEVQGERVAR